MPKDENYHLEPGMWVVWKSPEHSKIKTQAYARLDEVHYGMSHLQQQIVHIRATVANSKPPQNRCGVGEYPVARLHKVLQVIHDEDLIAMLTLSN